MQSPCRVPLGPLFLLKSANCQPDIRDDEGQHGNRKCDPCQVRPIIVLWYSRRRGWLGGLSFFQELLRGRHNLIRSKPPAPTVPTWCAHVMGPPNGRLSVDRPGPTHHIGALKKAAELTTRRPSCPNGIAVKRWPLRSAILFQAKQATLTFQLAFNLTGWPDSCLHLH